jgi:hypothetical protein
LNYQNYKTALEIAFGLEAIKKYRVKNTDIPEVIASYMYKTGEKNLESLNILVERLLASGVADKDQRIANKVALELTPDILLTSDFLVNKIRPWVEKVRAELFSSPAVPFKNFADAEQWIKQQEKLEPLVNYDALEPFHKTLIEVLNKRLPINYSFNYPALFYLGSDGKPHDAKISHRAPQDWTVPQTRENARKFTALNWLENETRIMARGTGFSQTSLVNLVLTGTAPILQRYKVTGHIDYQSLPTGEELNPIHINMEIWARDLTFEELRSIYNDCRETLQLKKHKLKEGKELAKSHQEIYQLVKANGGPPKAKGKVKFWESIKKEWNDSHPQGKYRTWKGIKLAYDRIMSNLEYRAMGKGVSQ